MGTRIPFTQPDGKTAEGYLASAGKANAPGVVVIQEWWGLQDQIKGLCDRFALAGYDALAPDLYSGTVIPYHDTEAAAREMNSLNFLEATDQAVRGAAQFLLRGSSKVAIAGFCMGGAVTVIGACRVPEFSAAVTFYGIPPEEAAKPADVRVPLQGHFANDDDFASPEKVDAFAAAMKAAGKNFDLYRYDASHAFMNEQRTVHDRASAEAAWGRVRTFLSQHIG
ncbi:carboxymethylenebutenolidase [Hyphomicrobium methylovorum]|uniref:dienelactone hydrolase family protein n=1 Tax=Hyphomicrobium methylovorum TaxID=84 RepID=UPI0015E7DAAB|nr:dienelactone hydrolase family protein [Hyphomicrobium methylovorum]MBA2125549.1 carboxymethylenebutenolidase [Hyphomicrobium methylovorum]